MSRLDPYIASRLVDVIELCSKFDVLELFFFGSAVDGRFNLEKSDLDVLVNFDDKDITNIVRFKRELERIYNLKVDVFCERWIVDPSMQAYLKKWQLLIYRKETLGSKSY